MSATTAKQLRDMVNNTLGKDVVQLGTDKKFEVSYQPTGLLPIDILLQGGMPRGRMTEFYGDYSTLKSYVAYKAMASYQSIGKTVGLIDTEHAWDESWAQACGVKVDDVIIQRPETGELGMDTADAMIRGGIDFLAWDSIAATVPQQELSKRFHGESMSPGTQARLMSAGLRKLTVANNHTSIMFINQTRLSIGVTFGNPESFPGGRAMPYYASYRVNLRKVGKVTTEYKTFDGEKWIKAKLQTGQKYKAEVTKSKLSSPFKEIWFVWDLETGSIDIPSFVVAQGLELGIINQRGNTWIAPGGAKAVGREKFLNMVAGDLTLLNNLENEVRTKYSLPLLSPGPSAPRKKRVIVKRRLN